MCFVYEYLYNPISVSKLKIFPCNEIAALENESPALDVRSERILFQKQLIDHAVTFPRLNLYTSFAIVPIHLGLRLTILSVS